MPMSKFERAHKAINLGLSRLAAGLPILIRVGLLVLFIWYGVELVCNASNAGAGIVLVVAGGVFLGILVIVLVSVMVFTYREYSKSPNADPPASKAPLWPFLLINLFMILLVSVVGKWARDRGLDGLNHGLLGFTQYWVLKIGILLTGGR